MKPLGAKWRQKHLDPKLQKYIDKPAPTGFGVLYAYVKTTGHVKAYIGKASARDDGARYRMRGHIRGPLKPNQKSVIHDAIVKHGKDNFCFFILALVPKSDLNQAEKDAIKKYDTFAATSKGYNVLDGGDGGKLPEEAEARRKCGGVGCEFHTCATVHVSSLSI